VAGYREAAGHESFEAEHEALAEWAAISQTLRRAVVVTAAAVGIVGGIFVGLLGADVASATAAMSDFGSARRVTGSAAIAAVVGALAIAAVASLVYRILIARARTRFVARFSANTNADAEEIEARLRVLR